DAIFDGVAGSQEQNGSDLVRLPQAGEDLEAIAAGQHQVEDDAVEGLGEGEPIALVARGGGDDLVPLGPQAALQAAENFTFVLDDQHARHDSPPLKYCRRGGPLERSGRWIKNISGWVARPLTSMVKKSPTPFSQGPIEVLRRAEEAGEDGVA